VEDDVLKTKGYRNLIIRIYIAFYIVDKEKNRLL